MAAASVSMAVSTRASLAFEDYSIYSDLSDNELIQLAIDRSLTDVYSPSSVSSQPGIQRSSSLLPAASHEGQNVCTEDTVRMRTWTKRNGILEVTVNQQNISAICSAIWRNDTPKLLKILQEEPSEILSKPNKEGWLHLHEAAHYGQVECLRVLINAFPRLINKRTNKSCTPLMLAVTRKHLSCVQCLLMAGAYPNITNELGESALYKACEKEAEETVELLLKFGAKVSMGSVNGVTPLHEAVRNKNIGICQTLLRAGANIRARNMYGIEPLFAAAQGGGTNAMNLLIGHGADIDCQAKDGATPLYEASKNGHPVVVMLLLSKGADVNKTTRAGLTPLHIASKNGHARIVSSLIPHTDRSVVERSGISPLHLAAEHNRDEVLEILIEAGFDVNTLLLSDRSQVYDDRCCTALHFSVRSSNIEAAAMLLEAGADPNVDTFNPLLVAVRKGNAPMASLLVQYGANVNACVPTYPTTFPGALLFCMKHTPMFKFLLDNGCNANACFSCVYGNGTHPPVKRRRATRDDLDLDDFDALHTAAQFCEIIADPLYSQWAGPIIDRLLDYTGPVKLCSRILELLESKKDWWYIKERTKLSFCLMHLCRQRIRQQVGHQRLRRMTSLPLPARLIKYLFYDSGESRDGFSYHFD